MNGKGSLLCLQHRHACIGWRQKCLFDLHSLRDGYIEPERVGLEYAYNAEIFVHKEYSLDSEAARYFSMPWRQVRWLLLSLRGRVKLLTLLCEHLSSRCQCARGSSTVNNNAIEDVPEMLCIETLSLGPDVS